MDDSILLLCNETELLGIARRAGLGNLKRGMPHGTLAMLIAGELDVTEEHTSEITFTRSILEKYIHSNWGRAGSQLPGCTGTCTTFKCSEGRHASCFIPTKGQL